MSGMIRPPPNIKPIIEKTASFIAQKGDEFADRILSDPAKAAKFKFLRAAHPFFAYYRSRVEALRKGEPAEPAEAAEASSSAAAPTTTPADAVVAVEDNKTTLEKVTLEVRRSDPAELAPLLESTVDLPTHAPENADCGAIALLASITALKGRDFLGDAAAELSDDPRFNFLKSDDDATFAFFKAYLEACETAKDVLTNKISAKKTLLDSVGDSVGDHFLKVCVARAHAEIERAEREAARSGDRSLLLAQVDWNDFVVVETIDFADDDENKAVGDAPEEEEHLTEAEKIRRAVLARSSGRIEVSENYVAEVETGSARVARKVQLEGEQLVNVDDLDEHMKTELKDAITLDNKAKFIARTATSNLEDSDKVAENLARLAKKKKKRNAAAIEEDSGDAKKRARPAVSMEAAQEKVVNDRVSDALRKAMSTVPRAPKERNGDAVSAPDGGAASGDAKPKEGFWMLEIFVQAHAKGKPEWNLNGQRVKVSIKPTATVAELKKAISEEISGSKLPLKKFQVKHAESFLKDKMPLAKFGVCDGSSCEVKFKAKR